MMKIKREVSRTKAYFIFIGPIGQADPTPAWQDIFYAGNNNIRDKGCKHLTKTHMPNLWVIELGKQNLMKIAIMLSTREHGSN